MLGTYALRSGYYDAYYRGAQIRPLISATSTLPFSRSICSHADHADSCVCIRREGEPIDMYLGDVSRCLVTSPGCRGISVPCGLNDRRSPDRRAAAWQAARRGTLLRGAPWIEASVGLGDRRPKRCRGQGGARYENARRDVTLRSPGAPPDLGTG